ncbi:transcriptional regulator, TraR/DksA family [Micromonospora pattaloongensis]|uniref:Transcriptional regulator, TraR/DksA family n=1 Tax=Micromonospora pattaloongensis TaxID=405436 RepID=A0A1H3LNG2_9ACTN|nr:TraR/DksA C4-type zinc finger protein [Micromonospora pattaloongensis]SDY65385.1 transcriptional regulator, TraR/DksA family [Micromonospora pattaloongensis]
MTEQTVEQLLAAERAGTMQQIADLSRDLGGIIDASALVATDDEHDPEGSTIAFERAQVTALLTRARTRLEELDRALERLRTGDYGVCEGCGQPIAAERLAVRPSATMCITCASAVRR